ncbi:Transmembrane protein of unknown function (DUF3566) [Parafrankia irregularis]|uniref:DUF3566 domain-containing protein n=1 Tax=Parafrankia irregularis TaxID=795642 RepID=A0A0S4QQC6_9ACTN|nr:Transmembrane protein of unknown function (DUF3566) [Parafrankia irregularis]
MGAGRLDDPDLTRRPGDAASAAAADGGSDAPRRSSLPGTGRGESRADDGRPAGGGPSGSSAGSAGSGSAGSGSAAGSGGASSPFFQRNGRDSSSSNDRGKAPGAARSEARSGAAAAGEPTKEGNSSAGSGSGSSGSASGSGTPAVRKPGGTDRATPAPRGSDADRGAGARTTTAKTTVKSTDKTTSKATAGATTRDSDPADPGAGDPRKPSAAKTRTGTDTRTPATAAGPNTARTDGSRSDTTRKHDAQSTVTTPAARPTSALDGPRDTDTISLVRPNLPRRGTGSTTDRGGDSMKKTDRAAVTERMPAERRPTPEPVRAGSAAGRPTPAADRTAPYDRPGTPPGVQPPPGRLGPGALSTEPLGTPDGPMPSRPGPLGPPGPQAGPRGPQSPPQGGRDHGGYEPLRSDRAEPAERRPPASGRRARLRLSRVEPLSVTKLSFAFSLCVFLIMMVAVAVLWFVLNSIGVFDSVTDAADTLTNGTDADVSNWLSFGRAMQISLLVGAINVVLMTALATLGALLYNLCAEMIGGLEVTLSDQ